MREQLRPIIRTIGPVLKILGSARNINFGFSAFCIALVACLAGVPTAAVADERVALILAAEDYQSFKPSAIGVDRAKQLSDALSGHGFDVTLEANPNNARARAALRDFASRVNGAEAALVFLMGHGATSGGRTFFLPANAEIRRSTDLLSRGLTVDSVAQIVGGAKRGAVMFFMTVADISSTLDGVSARAQAGMQPADNVTVIYSSSDKVPVSSVNSVSVRAAADAIEVMAEDAPKISVLIDAASAGGVGIVSGSSTDLDLAKPSEPDPALQAAEAEAAAKAAAAKQAAENEAAARAAAQSEAQTAAEEEARKEAEARAREAENRAIAAEERAREAEQRAKAEAERARKAAADRAAERERAAAADAEARAAKQAAALAEAEANAAAAKRAAEARASADAEQPSNGSDIASLQVVEALLGRAQRRQIQRELRQLDLYSGPIDSIFGPQTREAIKLFQKNNGSEETGYLTPAQFQKLVGG